jgi:CBS domain-containing protein
VTISIGISKAIGHSVFSSISKANNLPFLDEITPLKYKITAEQIMEKSFVYLTPVMKLSVILEITRNLPGISLFPVVKSQGMLPHCLIIAYCCSIEDLTLVGQVTMKYLQMIVRNAEKNMIYDSSEKFNHKSKRSRAKELLIHEYHKITHPFASKEETCNFQQLSIHGTLNLQLYWNILIFLPWFRYIEDKDIHLDFQDVPVQLVKSTSLGDIHMFFITLQLIRGFVVDHGILVGVITRDRLRYALSHS